MKKIKVFILTNIFIFLILLLSLSFNIIVLAETKTVQASTYRSDGDLIEGWNWLRDLALQHYAEWTFEEITPGEEDLILDITALATDRLDGGRGFEAKFKLIYGFPGSGNMGGVFKTKTVVLSNILAPDDPVGYTCQEQVSIDRAFIPGAATILIRIERESPQDNHIAFRLDSIVMLIGEEKETDEQEKIEEQDEVGEEEQQITNTDTWEGANLIQSGNYTGCLGEDIGEGQRDNDNYYQIYVEKGQLITLQLTIPGNASYNLALLNPNRSSQGSSITQLDTKTLDYVADSTGTWYIRVSRSSGEGEYQLSVAIENQNDAGSGQDAGDSYQEAIPISDGTLTGLLKAGDNDDYYSINLQKGQQINLQLWVPGNANYNISLLNPNRNSRGSSITQLDTKTLDYVADSTGTWYIRISRSSGEGEYQLYIENPEVYHGDNGGEDTETSCSFTLSNYEMSTGFSGGLNTIYVTTSSPDCQWSAEVDVPWIRILVGSSGSGAGLITLEYIIAGNDGPERIGHITIGDKVHTVIQPGRPCNIEFSSYHSTFQSAGGTGEFTVTPAYSGCQWAAVSDVSWIQIYSGSSGPGSQTLSFSVQENSGTTERTGHISVENKIHVVNQQPKLILSLSDEGRALNSNIPIFVSETEKGSDIDSDGDGILQEWEDKAMEYINPKFELDEDEDWFEHPEHHVVNFVRVFPYTKVQDNEEVQYIIFTYAVTWSKDYGRAGFYGHNGDVERVIMAWEVMTAGGKNMQLRYVFTSAHGGDNDHSAVWHAWNRDCFTRGIVAWPFDEEMCGQLTFEENILKLQMSEDKHAIYPTVSCCEDVSLVYLGGGFVMEDCGGGNTWRFDCYNAGEPEPDYYLIDDLDNPSSWRGLSENKRESLTNLFYQEQVWSGRKGNPDKFCGGLAYEDSSPGLIGNKLRSIPSDLENKL
jgi:hypothetical protein